MEDLVEVSEMRMGRWCDELAEKIAWWKERGKEICEELWQDWLSMHNKVAERGIGYQSEKEER